MSMGIGDVLRDARRRQGASLSDAADVTKVRESYLAALEQEEFDGLGGDVYVKGFIASYAAVAVVTLGCGRNEADSDQVGGRWRPPASRWSRTPMPPTASGEHLHVHRPGAPGVDRGRPRRLRPSGGGTARSS
jgi:hypothetical protein